MDHPTFIVSFRAPLYQSTIIHQGTTMDVDYYLKGGKKSVLVFALIIIQLPFMSVVLYTHTYIYIN